MVTAPHMDYLDKWFAILCQRRHLLEPKELQKQLPALFGANVFSVHAGAWATMPHVNLSLSGEMAHVWSNMCKHLVYLVRETLFHDLREPQVRAWIISIGKGEGSNLRAWPLQLGRTRAPVRKDWRTPDRHRAAVRVCSPSRIQQATL